MITADASGNLFVTERSNPIIRKITPEGIVTTLAGDREPGNADGTGSTARFTSPTGITTDAAGNLYVADLETIRKITPSGVVTTVAGVAGRQGILLGNLPGGLDKPFGLKCIGLSTLIITTGNTVLKLIFSE